MKTSPGEQYKLFGVRNRLDNTVTLELTLSNGEQYLMSLSVENVQELIIMLQNVLDDEDEIVEEEN